MSQHPFQNFMVRYDRGQNVFAEGDAGTTMYIVQSGRVGLYREVDGERRSVAEMEKGDFFGEMSILEGLPRTISAEAIDDAELIEINSMIFDKMIRSNIEIAVRMLRKLSIRLRDAECKVADFQVSGARAGGRVGAESPDALQAKEVACTGARLEAMGNGAAFAVGERDRLIGRYDPVTEQNPDIDLTDLDLKRSVSRRHARIVRSGDEYMVIEEVGALNGTFVNDTKLVPGQGCPIADGDRLNIGTVSLVFKA